MNIKDLIIPFALALLTTWALQHFFFGKKNSSDPYRFTAPQSAMECKPLMKEVAFSDTKRVLPEQTVTVETAWGLCEFSTDGASLSRLEFAHMVDGKMRVLGTIFPPENSDQEHRAFIVALQDKTPYYYTLVGRQENDKTTEITFQAKADHGVIHKTFTVYKEINQLDVAVQITPAAGHVMQARMFYPAPIMPGLKEDVVSADVIDGTQLFNKITQSSILPDDGWIKPSLFGVENKYFIHAMIKDPNTFVQRAYFSGQTKALTAIVEGPVVDTQTTWTMSFYIGPKEVDAIKLVDSRLEEALDYSGIWAPISRFLLMMLNWLYEYLHNYGVAIIVLSVMIKLILIPFSLRAERGAKDRADMQKRLAYIQQKFKDDPEARAQAQAEFMRRNGLGLAGCLPMLAQIPIFFGLSRVLSSSIELYQAPFLWMTDLSARDPYYILPALVMMGMLAPAFTGTDTKQRLPLIAMALMFGAVSASLSAGLVMYIAISTLLNVMQSRIFIFFRLV